MTEVRGTEFGIPYVEHQFGPSQTISAVLKLKNGMGLTPRQMNMLTLQYNKLNQYIVPKPGQIVRIPLINK